MRPRPHATTILALVGIAACVRTRPASRPSAADSAVLEVRNDYATSVNVYAVREAGGVELRVGQVLANRTTRFRLDPQVIGGATNILFVAAPASTQARPALGRAVTGVFALRPRDVVRFNVTSDLRSSTAFLVY